MVKSVICVGLFILIGVTSCAPARQVAVTETPGLNPATATIPATALASCKPTLDDGVSPSYVPNAPERTIVGHGHVVMGIVLSGTDCKSIVHVKLEFWPEEGNLGHPDSSRATFYTDETGHYRFECNMPDHIHMRISAPGYKTIGVNSYHPNGAAIGTFNIVLEPEH